MLFVTVLEIQMLIGMLKLFIDFAAVNYCSMHSVNDGIIVVVCVIGEENSETSRGYPQTVAL